MVEEPTPDYLRPGHHLDPGSFTLDLYRLLCMVKADNRVAKLGIKSRSISELQGEYLDYEVKRILISSAAALRIWFDQHDQQAFAHLRTDCGKLYPNWPRRKNVYEVLTLREACNKIIHATEINYDIIVPNRAHNYDYEGAYMRPRLFLYGLKGKQRWRAVLSLVSFVQWGTTVLWRWRS